MSPILIASLFDFDASTPDLPIMLETSTTASSIEVMQAMANSVMRQPWLCLLSVAVEYAVVACLRR